jgi:hypothetical protein
MTHICMFEEYGFITMSTPLQLYKRCNENRG